MRILLVEDDHAMAKSIEYMLRAEGHNPYWTDLGEEGITLAKLYDYDLIVLDLTLPDISGFEVLKTLRLGRIHTPVMILSGNNLVEAKVKALNLGADDYMTKPFHKDELVARAEAIVRRSRGHAHPAILIGDLEIKTHQRELFIKGAQVRLTRKEYQTIELLALHKGKTVTNEMFLDHIYGGLDEPARKIIDVFVCKVRRKLLKAGIPPFDYIRTVWGRGFMLDEPVPVNIAASA